MADRRSISSDDYNDVTIHEAISMDTKTFAQLSSSASAAKDARMRSALEALDAATKDAKRKAEEYKSNNDVFTREANNKQLQEGRKEGRKK
ncbi:hypothetical protein PAAG_05259 [Paracoccidioides lutzii Pb01]|uniref:Uncharacterized protein n=1 Tax=Paracoccidioides lutzii (strain ATCC MYA-826 / Pb01) TaxID=502779 RepID=C1H3B6_PARBA|nr:hypothetical protein PAAG_05259 [Paracoccidioides lutzii Pb01]EEH34210.2 hypothetical protein PAAG_05259 [Paracoccidioides lutzii Pb01]